MVEESQTGNVTLTKTSRYLEHPNVSVTRTIYRMLRVGLTVMQGQVEQIRPSSGDHLYLSPPLAQRVTFAPAGIIVSFEMEIEFVSKNGIKQKVSVEIQSYSLK